MTKLTLLLPLVLVLAGCPKSEEPKPVASVGAATVGGTPAAATSGAAVFTARCAVCHGTAGMGGMGPKLAGVAKKGEPYMRTTIVDGRADKGMPAFEGQLSEDEITGVIGYLKGL